MILNIVNDSLNDTKIVSTDPATNFRSDDLRLVGDPLDLNRICINFSVPTDLDRQSIVRATVNLVIKTITGAGTSPSISSALISQNTVDYRYVSWNNYNNGIAWTTPGGDIESSTIKTTTVEHSSVETTVSIDATDSVLYAIANAKSTMNLLIYTATSNTNITYYSRETANKGPKLELLYRDATTADGIGRTGSIPSIPSI